MTNESELHFPPEYEIKESDVPCWYEISWEKETKSIELKIHPDYIQNSKYKLGNDRLIEVLKERFNLGDFGIDFFGNIGFEGVFNNAEKDKNGLLVYHAKIPKIQYFTNQKCDLCHGEDSSCCHMCNGVGKKRSIDDTKLYPLCTSLSMLTTYLGIYPQKNTSANFPQLLTFHNHISEGSFSLSGNISLKLHNFVKIQSQEFLDNTVTHAMKDVMKIMYGTGSIEETSNEVGIFKNRFDGGINFGCFGTNGAGIALEHDAHEDIKKGHGYTFYSHNIVGIQQQVVLIAGLAALHDSARKEI